MKTDLSKINKRYIGSLVIIPIIISLIVGGLLLKAMILCITIFSLIEFSNALKYKKINVNKYLIIFFTIIYYVVGFKYIDTLVFMFFIFLLFYTLNKNNNIVDISLSFISIFYIVIPFSFIFILNEKNNYLSWIVFLSAWSTDTMAYFIGKNFGKHKISQNISPNKTLEGFIAGVISCVLVISIYGFLFNDKLNISILNLVFLSIFTGIVGQIGDLIASSIKRFVEIKDFGNLIPGHGGILDRFDSILMISIVVFVFSQILM